MRSAESHVLLHFTLLTVVALVTTAQGAPYTITTQTGEVVGHASPTYEGVVEWQGIPYGSPPTTELRFTPPIPPAAWSTPLVANASGPGCPYLVGPLMKGVEDCLSLDVYVPASALEPNASPKQVMVFIHGGGAVIGNDISDGKKGQKGLYDGSRFAAKHDVIVVAMDYRLSVLGFLALDELKAENPHGSTGNYGLQDQQLALKWVSQNIAAFGGDPSSVLLFGESAGAFSICWHLVSPASKGLFTAVLLESGNCDSPAFFRQYDRATNFSRGYAAHVGCDPASLSGTKLLDCLRALPLEKIIDGGVLDAARSPLGKYPPNVFWPKLAPIMPWGFAIDGSSIGLTGVPAQLIAQGKGHPVPVLMGTNGQEGALFIPMMPVIVPGTLIPLDHHAAEHMLLHFFNQTVYQDVMEVYPPSKFKDYDALAVTVLTDYFFVCSTRRLLRAVAAANPSLPRYEYRFVYPIRSPLGEIMGDYHSVELGFVFGMKTVADTFKHPDDWVMSDTIQHYWTNFARTHNPSSPRNTTYQQWPLYANGTEHSLALDVPTYTITDLGQTSNCDFWDQAHMNYD